MNDDEVEIERGRQRLGKLYAHLKPTKVAHLREDGEVMIDCPGCGNSHGIATKEPNASGAKWAWNGSETKPTFSPSVHIRVGPFPDGHMEICHSFIRDGKIEFLSDCTHELAGQTVDLPNWDD